MPAEWYRDEDHVGYDADGRRILKRKWNDSIEHLLHMVDDPSYWRKVFDEKEDRELAISQSQASDVPLVSDCASETSSSRR